MIDDREEIESVLQAGERILLEHPELYDMSLDDVLNGLPRSSALNLTHNYNM